MKDSSLSYNRHTLKSPMSQIGWGLQGYSVIMSICLPNTGHPIGSQNDMTIETSLLSKANASEVRLMSTVAMNREILNGLFDNQQKLDKLFNSIFDEDNFLINSSSSSTQSVCISPVYEAEKHFLSSGGNVKELLLAIKHNPYFYVLPIVLEMAVIYSVVINLF